MTNALENKDNYIADVTVLLHSRIIVTKHIIQHYITKKQAILRFYFDVHDGTIERKKIAKGS